MVPLVPSKSSKWSTTILVLKHVETHSLGSFHSFGESPILRNPIKIDKKLNSTDLQWCTNPGLTEVRMSTDFETRGCLAGWEPKRGHIYASFDRFGTRHCELWKQQSQVAHGYMMSTRFARNYCIIDSNVPCNMDPYGTSNSMVFVFIIIVPRFHWFSPYLRGNVEVSLSDRACQGTTNPSRWRRRASA